MKKPAAVLLALITLFGAVSCTVSRRTGTSNDTADYSVPALTYDPETYDNPRTSGIIKIDGREIEPDWVLKLDDYEVSYGRFRYYYINERMNTEDTVTVADTPTYWTDETEKALLDTVIDDLKRQHALTAYAASVGVVLDDEGRQYADNWIKSFNDYYGEEGAKLYYADQNIDEATLRLFREDTYIQNRLFYYLYDKDTGTERWNDADLKKYFEENYLRCKHVLVKFPTGADDAAKAQTLAKAQEIYKKAIAGEDFDKLVEEYGEDPGMTSNPDGYVFTEGKMVASFYEGTKALEIGGISEPIESSYGYHVIQRLDLTDESMESVLEEMLYGDGKYKYGIYGDLFNTKAQQIINDYDPDVTFNPEIENCIRHDTVC